MLWSCDTEGRIEQEEAHVSTANSQAHQHQLSSSLSNGSSRYQLSILGIQGN